MLSFICYLVETAVPHGFEHYLPPEPGTTPIPEGHVRLYHQTSAENIPSIIKTGLNIGHARGIEGPKSIYADRTGFYGSPGSRPTIEFSVPAHKFDSPFVLQDVAPESFIAVHLPWHDRARYIGRDPDLLKSAKAGELDHLLDHPDYGPAIRHHKGKTK